MVSCIPVHELTGADCKDEDPHERTEWHESKRNQSITLWDRKDGIFPNIVCNKAELLELKVGCCGSSGRESLKQFQLKQVKQLGLKRLSLQQQHYHLAVPCNCGHTQWKLSANSDGAACWRATESCNILEQVSTNSRTKTSRGIDTFKAIYLWFTVWDYQTLKWLLYKLKQLLIKPQ